MKTWIIILISSALCFAFTPIQTPIYVDLFESPQIVEISATLNKGKCNNKAFVAIDLPEDAKGWIYSVSAISKKDLADPKKQLHQKVLELADDHDSEHIVDFIYENQNISSGRKKSPAFNLYVLPGKENVESFYNCGCYKYIEKHIRTKPRSGYLENKSGETVYIGIESDRDLSNLRLQIEAVAIL
jgi:hypothetical protein